MNLDGSIAVVTGGTRGIGRGVGHELARHGARVFITGRSAPDYELIDKGITNIRCDHRVDTQVTAAFNRILGEASAIDILVNNVWGGYEGMVEDGNFTWTKPFWDQPLRRAAGFTAWILLGPPSPFYTPCFKLWRSGWAAASSPPSARCACRGKPSIPACKCSGPGRCVSEESNFFLAPHHLRLGSAATDLQQFELAFFKRTDFVWLLKSFQNDFKHERLLQFLGKCGILHNFIKQFWSCAERNSALLGAEQYRSRNGIRFGSIRLRSVVLLRAAHA